MAFIKKTAAARYLGAMRETEAETKAVPVKQKKPQRLIGGCVLYQLPLLFKQQHPPAPYYS